MRILFVAMPDSIHAVRWINLLSEKGWDIHLFPATAPLLHPDFKNITAYGVSCFREKGLDDSVRLRGVWRWRKASGSLNKLGVNSFRLARLIRRLQPDIIHSLEIQHAGYLTLEAKARLKGKFPAWAVTNWGSDLFYFGSQPEHASRIRGVLQETDAYACECHRDARLAKEFGFKGKNFPVVPNCGGFDLERARQLREEGATSKRRWILLKGYQGWAGRALVGLRAMSACASLVKNYSVGIYLADKIVKDEALALARSTGIHIEMIPRCSQEEMLRWHGRARVSIGLSMSDAISTSLLEAILMGSFPIQSNTACGDEWVRDDETGFIVPPENVELVATSLRRALQEDALVDTAAQLNEKTAAERLDRSQIKPQIIAAYESMKNTLVEGMR